MCRHFNRLHSEAMMSHSGAPITIGGMSNSSPAVMPYAGIRVVEFTHMVMGPTCGMVLGDLGAEVIKVEPPKGDNTRRLLGAGAGFFPMFNRNKKSLVLDLHTPEGKEAVLKLIATADVVSENFKTETMQKLGLDYESLKAINPRLIYVSHKGFLPGPYDHRTALDEVVQMMGGLAYMTGRSGDPLRAGSSVNDIMGGLFGAIGAMAALKQRESTGLGQKVESALFENNVFLVAQHMMQYAMTGVPANPMPERISPWGIYDVFRVKGDGQGEESGQIFLAVVSDTQWAIFCEAFRFEDLKTDERLTTNNGRVLAREWLMPTLRERLAGHTVAELVERFEAAGLPFAPITRPHDLLQDPHLLATGGLAPITLPDGARAGEQASTVLFPFTLNGERPGVRLSPPKLGEHGEALLKELGYGDEAISRLTRA
jgi:crotonobetainyl-CoA:carnitine CoA-transferase CaiB-like acyl-CoA transferase